MNKRAAPGRVIRRTPWAGWRDTALVALLLAAGAAATAWGGWALRLERAVYDAGLALRAPVVPEDVVIIAIDDASVQAIGRWPWPRAVHATLLEQLATARPRAIALDLLLSEPDPQPEQDRLLAAALLRAAPVVAPVGWLGNGAGHIEALLPAPALRPALQLGAAEAGVDSDGLLRHAFLQTRAAPVNGQASPAYPHLALALLQAGGQAVHPQTLARIEHASGPRRGALQRDGRFAIGYLGPPGTVARVSYVDVLSGAVPLDRFTGRDVLIGMTAQGLGDTLATPVNSRHLAMPGVEVHAHILHTLRSGRALAELNPATLAAGSAALVLALLAGLQRLGPRGALPLALAAPALALAAALAGLQAGWWVNPVPFVLAAVLAYPLWSWRRLEAAVRRLDGEISRLRTLPAPLALVDSSDPTPSRRSDSDPLEARLYTLRRVGEQLREARHFLAEALAALPTAVLVAEPGGDGDSDSDGPPRVLLANPQAAARFEVDGPDELLGLDLAGLLGEFQANEAVDWPAALAALQAGGPALSLTLHRGDIGRPDRQDLLLHASALTRNVGAASDRQRLIVSLADIGPIKAAEYRREAALAFVSHDLRSPAQSLLMLAELNQQGALQTPREQLLAEVQQAATRTLALAEGFVRAAQAETQALQRQTVAVQAVFDEVLAGLQAQALAAGVALQAQVDPGLVLSADASLLSRALTNLVGNALRHSPPGGRVVLAAHRRGDRLRLSVADQGSGLSPAQWLQLDEAAAQAQGGSDSGARVGHARGLGLGLLFVQRVARRHGGRLLAEAPRAGQGATLHLDWPVDLA